MKEDFVKQLGYLGFTMRLKRMSDAMMHEGRRLYAELDLDIEPNWYVIFKLLQSEGPQSITEISSSIRLAHPSVITITTKMAKAGYLDSTKDVNDSRKRVLTLSSKALEILPKYEKVWEAGQKGIEDALKDLEALEFISAMEVIFQEKGFMDRTIQNLTTEGS